MPLFVSRVTCVDDIEGHRWLAISKSCNKKVVSFPENTLIKYLDNNCPSQTFWVQMAIQAILRIWYHLKGKF